MKHKYFFCSPKLRMTSDSFWFPVILVMVVVMVVTMVVVMLVVMVMVAVVVWREGALSWGGITMSH